MEDSKCIGPIRFAYQGQSLLAYFAFIKADSMSMKCYFGSAFYFVPLYTAHQLFGYHFSMEMVNQNKRALDSLIDLAVRFMDRTDSLYHLQRKGVHLSGEEFLSSDHVYILGEKKEVSFHFIDAKGPSFFYGKNFESVQEQFAQLAKANLAKRVEKYASMMNLAFPVSFDLSTAVNYMGINYIQKKRILLNQALYCYKEAVGDAVVVHEVAHCFYPNHGKEFYSLVYRYCPKYEEYEKIIVNGEFREG